MDLVLNNLQKLICHKTQPTNTIFFLTTSLPAFLFLFALYQVKLYFFILNILEILCELMTHGLIVFPL